MDLSPWIRIRIRFEKKCWIQSGIRMEPMRNHNTAGYRTTWILVYLFLNCWSFVSRMVYIFVLIRRKQSWKITANFCNLLRRHQKLKKSSGTLPGNRKRKLRFSFLPFGSRKKEGRRTWKKGLNLWCLTPQLTVIKPTQTGIYRKKLTFCIIKSSEPLKKFKNQPRPLVRPSSVKNCCQNFLNLSRETVPLMVQVRYGTVRKKSNRSQAQCQE